jgi:hypothetical protein
MGKIVKFPSPRTRERIRRIRDRYASELPANRLEELGERLRTIEHSIATLKRNRRAILTEWYAEYRRIQAAERQQQVEDSGQ